MPRTQKQKIGDLGEGIACNYLKNKGFKVIDRNYWKPWGEIDIIVKKQGIIHFVEVKTVQMQNGRRIMQNKRGNSDVIRETSIVKNKSDVNFIKQIFKFFIGEADGVAHETHNNVNHETILHDSAFNLHSSAVLSTPGDKTIKKRQELDEYRPEDNVHHWKLKKLSRVIRTYLIEKDPNNQLEWKFDVITVKLSIKDKTAKIEWLKDIIL